MSLVMWPQGSEANNHAFCRANRSDDTDSIPVDKGQDAFFPVRHEAIGMQQ